MVITDPLAVALDATAVEEFPVADPFPEGVAEPDMVGMVALEPELEIGTLLDVPRMKELRLLNIPPEVG